MKNLKLKTLQVFFLLIISSLCFEASALLPYKYKWQKIKSPHFTVVVADQHKDFGVLVSQKAEEAFTRLQTFSDQHPKNTMIIVDHTKGYSNGAATFFPYPTITLQPVLPDSASSVGQYEDWLLELIIHEYTHILSFHNTRYLYRPLRWVLGSTISPGYFLPTWYQEGIAVFTETHFSNGGRLRGSKYQAYKDHLYEPNISFANEQETGEYPFGSAPYIFGAWLNQDSLGADPLSLSSRLHKKLSGRFPFFLNGAYKGVTEKSLYKTWRESFGKKKEPAPENAFLGFLPSWDQQEEELYFVRLDPYLFHDLVKKNKDSTEVLIKQRNLLDFKKVDDLVYFVSLKLQEQDHQRFSLSSYNLKTKETTALSQQDNIRSFDANKDQIVYIKASLEKFEIATNTTSWDNESVLYEQKDQTRLDLVTFKNKKNILFTQKATAQKEELVQMDLETKSTQVVFTADHILHFDVYRGQVFVLYEDELKKELINLTNDKRHPIKNEVIFFEIESPKVIHTTLISNKGLQIAQLRIKDLIGKSSLEKIERVPSAESHEIAEVSTPRPYSSFYKLAPHYIMPALEFSPYGFSEEYLYGVSTGGKDPLDLHSYNIMAFTDSITNEVSSAFSYSSRHFRMPWTLSAGLFNEPLSREIFRKSTYASLSTSLPYVSSFSKGFNLGLGLHWNKTEVSSGDIKRAGLNLTLLYNRAEQRSRELAPRKGLTAYFRAEQNLKLDSYYDYLKLSLGLKLFMRSPLVSTHRLVLGLDAGFYDKDVALLFAENSQNQVYRNMPSATFGIRGLPTGALFANKSYATLHGEYRFPLININWGPGLLPGFFNRITGALTADYALAKGYDFIHDQSFDHETKLYAAGGEIIFEGKLFYHLPASMQVGLYKFLNTEFYDGDPEIFVGFGIGGLPQ